MVEFFLIVLMGGGAVGAMLLWWGRSSLRVDVLSYLLPKSWLVIPRKEFRGLTDQQAQDTLSSNGRVPLWIVTLCWCPWCHSAHFSAWVAALAYPFWIYGPSLLWSVLVLWGGQSAIGLMIFTRTK